MISVSRSRYERKAFGIGLIIGSGLLMGYLLVIVPMLYMRGFERLGRPLVGGVICVIVAVLLPVVVARASRTMEPKIKDPSVKESIFAQGLGYILGICLASSFAFIYHEIWGVQAVVVPFIAMALLWSVVTYVNRWSEKAA